MSRARDLADLIGGGFTEADIPNLSASKITSGTFADARIAASNVSQHASSFDDNKIINDLSYTGYNFSTNYGLQNNINFNLRNLNSVGKNDNEYKSSPQLELMYLQQTQLALMFLMMQLV